MSISTRWVLISSAMAVRPVSAIRVRCLKRFPPPFEQGDLVAASVLSGNRNFEGRINPDCKANYLASPPLVVAYALAGSVTIDLLTQPLGNGKDGKPVFLKDIWPTNEEIKQAIATALTPEMFRQRYSNVFAGPKKWQEIKTAEGMIYQWEKDSPTSSCRLCSKGCRAQAATGHRC